MLQAVCSFEYRVDYLPSDDTAVSCKRCSDGWVGSVLPCCEVQRPGL